MKSVCRPTAPVKLIPTPACPYSACRRSTIVAPPCASGASTSGAGTERELRIPLGRIVLRPISADDAKGTGLLLTRCFADQASLDDVLADVNGMLMEKEGVFIVARLFPDDAKLLPPGQTSRLAGAGSVALSPNAQCIKRLPAVNLPPADSAYISNMAVDPKFRRMGIAQALLEACESAGRAAGKGTATLHVRESDPPARSLYAKAGYGEVTKDGMFDCMRLKIKARLLMRKQLL